MNMWTEFPIFEIKKEYHKRGTCRMKGGEFKAGLSKPEESELVPDRENITQPLIFGVLLLI